MAKRLRYAEGVIWFFKPILWPMLIGVLVLLVPLSLPCWLGSSAWELSSVRLAGLALQLAGLVTVVLGLSQSRETFGKRGIWKGLRRFGGLLKSVVSPPEAVKLAGRGVKQVNVSARGSVTLPEAREGWSLEDRVIELEKELKGIEKEARGLKNSIYQSESRLRHEIDAEKRARFEADKSNARQMKEAVIGGIHLEAAGVVYLALGAILATFPALFMGRVACLF